MPTTMGAGLGIARDALNFSNRILFPLLLFAVRIWLAQIFLIHGFEFLSRPVDPSSITDFDVLIQVIPAVLIGVGLFTRLAALPIAYLSFFFYFGEFNISGHILCALLALAVSVYGPGPLSLDAILGRGLKYSPLPFSEWPERVYLAFQWFNGPLLQLALRLWMAALFWMTAEQLINDGPLWIDLGNAVAPAVLEEFRYSGFSMVAQLVCAVLLAVGFATRPAAFILVLVTLVALFGEGGRPEHLLWALVLGHLLLSGPGIISLDKLLHDWLLRTVPEYSGKPAFNLDGLPKVVIVGAGFAGLAAAKALAKTRVQITIIDRHNYHLFQPLLYQVATAGLSPADIATPIRGILRNQFNAKVLFGKVDGVNAADKFVTIGESRLPYDYLVLATGARHAYFGRDEWEGFAPGLKKIDDATHVRKKILLAFERAETAVNEKERQRHLTFVVVGAGPTGVEMAGSIAELAHHGMESDFRLIDPRSARVLLVQAAPRVLPMFPETLSEKAQKSLEDKGVEVLLNSRVTQIDEIGVNVDDTRIPAGTVIWAAGVRASPAARWLECEADSAGRAVVGADLTVPGHQDVFVVGDTAMMNTEDGKPVPGLAPAAKQSGQYVAKVINARILGQAAPDPFRYIHAGSLATIGRDSAIADFGWVRLSGRLAWWLWGVVHIFFLVGARNRAAVVLNWFWSYITYSGSTRLITGKVDENIARDHETKTISSAAE